MYGILKELLFDLKCNNNGFSLNSIDKKIIALESAIEVLEKLRSETDEEN